MRLPPELELEILSYVEPNPVVYTRLATVSKFYYSYFTSDKKWLSLDIHNKKSGLFRYYCSVSDLAYLKRCWDSRGSDEDLRPLFTGRRVLLSSYNSSLSKLGLLRHYRHEDWKDLFERDEGMVIDSEQCARIAVGINYQLIALVDSAILQENPDIVEHCGRHDPSCLDGLAGDVLVQHKELIISELKERKWFNSEGCLVKLLSHAYDRNFIWEAAEYQHGLYEVLEHVNEEDLRVHIKVGFYCRLSLAHPRDKLQEIFSRSVEELYSDVELFRDGIAGNPQLLEFTSETVRDDSKVVSQAVAYNSNLLNYASPRLLADADFWATAVNSNAACFSHVPDEIRESKQFRTQLNFNEFLTSMIEALPASYWDDEIVVYALMRRDHFCNNPSSYFKKASARVRQNRDFVVQAVEISAYCYEFIGPNFQKDRDIALLAVKSNPWRYHRVPEELRGDKELAMAAVSDLSSFSFLNDNLRHDKDVVLKAVDSYPKHRCPYTFLRARFPLEFWGDRDVALKMVRKLPASYFYLTDEMKMDKRIVLAAFEGSHEGDIDEGSSGDEDSDSDDYSEDDGEECMALDYNNEQECPLICSVRITWVPEIFHRDLEVARAAVIAAPCNYNALPVDVRSNKEITKLALESSFGEIAELQVDASYLPFELLDNEEIMSCAVKILGHETFLLASSRLKGQASFVSVLFELTSEVHPKILDAISPQVWADRKLVLQAAQTTRNILELAPSFQKDEEIVAAARILAARKSADPFPNLFRDGRARHKQVILRAIAELNRFMPIWYKRQLKGPMIDWLNSASERVRAAVVRHFNDNIDVLHEYLALHRLRTAYSTYRSDILPQLSPKMRCNREIVMMCIRGGIHGDALTHASPRLRHDHKFILSAIAEIITNVVNLPKLYVLFPPLDHNLDLAVAAMGVLIKAADHSRSIDLFKGALCIFTSACQRLQESPRLIEKIAQIHEVDPCFLPHYLPDHLRDSKVIMMELVSCKPCMFCLATHRLRGDFDLLSRAMELDSGNRVYAWEVGKR